MNKTIGLSFLALSIITGGFILNTNVFGISETIGQWSFEESTGTTVYDDIGTNNGGFKNGIIRTTGKVGSGIELDGVDDFVAFNTNYGAYSDNLSISVWAKAESLGKLSPVLGSIYGVSNTYPRLFVTEENRVGFELDSNNKVASAKNTFFKGEWTHLAASYDSNNQLLKLYINGELSAETSTSGSIPTGGKKFFIGRDANNFFHGKIDELEIHHSTLTDREIFQKYDLETPTPPSNIVSSITTNTEISLIWDHGTDDTGIQTYNIYRDGVLIAQTQKDYYIDAFLNPGQSYTYQIESIDKAEKISPLSESISQTTRLGKTDRYSLTFLNDDRVVIQSESIIGTHPNMKADAYRALALPLPGAHGSIISGGTYARGKYWWLVDFDEGFRAWVSENDIKIDQDTGLKAFPSAEGYGADTPGGRGGQVIKVTNLNDSGTGSLRAALTSSGARIVTFDVSGVIEIETPIFVRSPYLTIAGQTAPGQGIIIKNSPDNNASPVYIDTHDVIIRHMRFRPGASTELSKNLDALTLYKNARNIIIDHSSFSWAVDENFNGEQANDITVQWSIFSEGLKNSTHCNSDCSAPGGSHSRGMLFGGPNTGLLSIHHNLFMSNQRRNPEITARSDMPVDIVNNYIYNPQTGVMEIHDNDGNTQANLVGNRYEVGPDTNLDPYMMDIRVSDKVGKAGNGDLSLYLVGNYDAIHRTQNDQNEKDVLEQADWQFVIEERINTPFVATTSQEIAKQAILRNAGANAQGYDEVDQRLFKELKTGQGDIPNDVSTLGGWPVISSVTALQDTDNDGIPDDFENMYPNFLDSLNPVDAQEDQDGDGYTNIEEYLNILAGDANNIELPDAFTPPLRPQNLSLPKPKSSGETSHDGQGQ